jgi:hypothetical protein
MSAICASSILACGFRATLLDDTGNVHTGSDNYYVTDKMVQLQLTPEIEAGSDRTVKSGCDCIIATAKFPDLLKRFNFEIQLGQLEPGLISLMTGSALISSGADPIGFDFPNNLECGQTPPPKVAIEAWSYVWEIDHQSETLPYWHWVWPMAQWQFGQSTLNSDVLIPVLTGYSRANPVWAHGPYNDDPGVPIGPFGAVWQTATAPPAAVCGLQTVVPAS